MWEKVVLNLLSNAFKYTFNGKITVRLETRGERAVLSVEDTGGGIPELELPHLFERFHRVEGARGRTQEGTGIGLALVSELVQLQGGAVDVRSAVGRGTVFTVSIPLGTAHLPRDRMGDAPDASGTALQADAYIEEAARWLPLQPTPAATRAARGRVLVADDNADMRDYVA